MDLVIGGAFQGKLSWAAREYDLKPEELCDLAAEEPRAGARCCFHLEELTRRDADAARYLPQLLAADVVVSREVGSGVVPVDKNERAAREAAGRLGCLLAQRADAVVRVFCGIPVYLKGAPNT